MRSISSREEILEAFDGLDAALDRVLALDCATLSTRERLALLQRCERVRRRLPAVEHPLINEVVRGGEPSELGGSVAHALADQCSLSRTDATRRIHEAADLGPRRSLTGDPLPPLLEHTAAGQRAGDIGPAHINVIRGFLHQLPGFVDAAARTKAEQELARHARDFRPDQLAKLAQRLSDCLNPDGNFTDEDRSRRRGLVLGRQQADGMSELRGYLSPELRATLEAAWAKLAAPGMCDPGQETPTVDGTPSAEAVEADTRSAAQRNHDGLLAGLRALLASGKLGAHNGLPATVVITTTLAELESTTGHALTGGGSLLPMRDVIRMARHAHHYLAIFDKGKAVALYHTKRLASAGLRIVLYAKDRGCSHPGCDVSGYYCEVHHVEEYSRNPETAMENLTFACGPHHTLLTPGGWRTRVNSRGETEWIPPLHMQRDRPRTNTFHHPEKLLGADTDADTDTEADDTG